MDEREIKSSHFSVLSIVIYTVGDGSERDQKFDFPVFSMQSTWLGFSEINVSFPSVQPVINMAGVE